MMNQIPIYFAKVVKQNEQQNKANFNQKNSNIRVRIQNNGQNLYNMQLPQKSTRLYPCSSNIYYSTYIKQIPKLQANKKQIELANYLKRYKHNNIMRIYDVFYIDKVANQNEDCHHLEDSYYIVMEYFQKPITLNQFIKTTQITQQQVLEILLQIAKALQFLRSQKAEEQNINKNIQTKGGDDYYKLIDKKPIMYQEIKQQNILVQSSNQKIDVKLNVLQFVWIEHETNKMQSDQKTDILPLVKIVRYLLIETIMKGKEFDINILANTKYKDLWYWFLSQYPQPTIKNFVIKLSEQKSKYNKSSKSDQSSKVFEISEQEKNKIKNMTYFVKIESTETNSLVEVYNQNTFNKNNLVYTFDSQNILYNKQGKKQFGNSIIYDKVTSLLSSSSQKRVVKQIPIKFEKNLKYIFRQVDVFNKLKNKEYHHKNIIDVFDVFYLDKIDGESDKKNQKIVGQIQQSFYFVTGYYQESQSLNRWIAYKQLEQEKLFEIVQQIVQGLEFIHNRIRLAHRDIKPENVIIFNENNKINIKIIDFGLAKTLDLIYNANNTQVGSLGGYMAPEIAQKNDLGLKIKYSQKCDLWSMGALIYYLLTKQYLTKSLELKQYSQQIKQIDIVEKIKKATQNKKYEEFWTKILQKTLVIKPEERVNSLELKQIIKYFHKKQKSLFHQAITKQPIQINEIKLIVLLCASLVKIIKKQIFLKRHSQELCSTELCELGKIFSEKLIKYQSQLKNIKASQFIEYYFKTDKLTGQQHLKQIYNYGEQITKSLNMMDSQHEKHTKCQEKIRQFLDSELQKLWEIKQYWCEELDLEYQNFDKIPFQQGLFRSQQISSFLKILHLNDNNIKKIQNLSELTSLKILFLDNNQIKKIQGINSLINLERLMLNNNQIEKIQNLEQLINLKQLQLNKNKIKKIEGLDKLQKLKILQLSNNQISKIENLENLNLLYSLSLDVNLIRKIEGLNTSKNMKNLQLSIFLYNLCYNQISKIEGLEKMKDLRNLELIDNRITKIGEFRNFHNLRTVDLRNNPLCPFEKLQPQDLRQPDKLLIICSEYCICSPKRSLTQEQGKKTSNKKPLIFQQPVKSEQQKILQKKLLITQNYVRSELQN